MEACYGALAVASEGGEGHAAELEDWQIKNVWIALK